MKQIHKSALYSAILLLVIVAIFFIRRREATGADTMHLEGVTMGTVAYHIKYLDKQKRDFKKSLDSLFQAFNQSLSTYIKDSEISRFNSDTVFLFESNIFYPVLAKSREVYLASGGAFDPTVAPLVNAWGFGFKKEQFPDSSRVDSLRKLVGFDRISFDEKSVRKKDKNVTIDFSAIAGGYISDLAARFLESKNISDYMVEIGGEVVTKGNNKYGKNWTIGITNPKYKEAGQKRLFAVVDLEDMAMTTSGNYEKFYIKDGKKYAHTIHPKTGYPVLSSLLSATVFANDCMTADAYATAFMVLGLEESKKLLEKNKQLDAVLIYEDNKGKLQWFITKRINPFVRLE